MSDIAIAIRHVDEQLNKGQEWDNIYMTKLSRLGWLRFYVAGLPKEEQKEYTDEIALLRAVINHLLEKREENNHESICESLSWSNATKCRSA